MRKEFLVRTRELVSQLTDFPKFKYWDFNKKEFESRALNKMSSDFVTLMVAMLADIAGNKMSKKELVGFTTMRLLNAVIYAYFGNANYEADNENSYSGGDDSIQEQFTCWATITPERTYEDNLKDYRENKIYLGYIRADKNYYEAILNNQITTVSLHNLIKWVEGSDLLKLMNLFNTKEHEIFQDKETLEYTILKHLIYLTSEEEGRTKILKRLLSKFEDKGNIFTRKMIVGMFNKYYNEIEKQDEIYYYKVITNYMKANSEVYDAFIFRFLNKNEKANDMSEEIVTFKDVFETFLYNRQTNITFEDSYSSKTTLLYIVLDALKEKLDKLADELLDGNHVPFSLYDKVEDYKNIWFRLEYLLKTIKDTKKGE